MAEFVNPFVGVVPGKKLTLRELTRAIRLSLCAEEEAVHLYEALADATDNKLAQMVLQDIANEERVHKGEFQHLLDILLPEERELMDKGAREVDEMNGETEPIESSGTETIVTPGDLKSKSMI